MITVGDKARDIRVQVLNILGPDWEGRVMRRTDGAWCICVWTNMVGGFLYNGSYRRAEYYASKGWTAGQSPLRPPYSSSVKKVESMVGDDMTLARTFAGLLRDELRRVNTELEPKHERLAALVARLQAPWILGEPGAAPVGTRFRLDGRHLCVAWSGEPRTVADVWLQGRVSVNQLHGVFLDVAEVMRADNPGDPRWGLLLDMAEELGLLSGEGI